jgi:hypothetical protein
MEGKREEVLANRPVRPQAHLAEIDEEVELEGVDKPDDENILISEFAMMSFNQTNKINFPLMPCLLLPQLLKTYHWLLLHFLEHLTQHWI